MFKWNAYFYKNVDGMEEKIEKVFANEKEYDLFVAKHPEIMELKGLGFHNTRGYSLGSVYGFFDETEVPVRTTFFREIREEFRPFLHRSDRLIEK